MEIELDYNAVGERIKNARMDAGITQKKLADKTGLNSSYLSSIENGNRKIGLPLLITIANAIPVSVNKLLCDSLVEPDLAYNQAISNLLSDCTNYELRLLEANLRQTKEFIRKYVTAKEKPNE